MAFVTEKHLEGSKYVYQLAPTVKKFTLKDTTFIQTKILNLRDFLKKFQIQMKDFY